MPTHDAADESYDPGLFEVLRHAEDCHFWFRSRGAIITRLMRRLTSSYRQGYRVLEIGCGSGNVLRDLERACPGGAVVGMDLFREGFGTARGRCRCALVQADIHHPPFRARFDFACLFDVLEHIRDDRRVLADLHAVLKPGGRIVLTVPAHPAMWSYADEVAHHVRRYTQPELASKLANTGYVVEYITPYMMCLAPPMWLSRLTSAATGGSGADPERQRDMFKKDLKVRPGLNVLMSVLLRMESPLVGCGFRLPLGASLLAVARQA